MKKTATNIGTMIGKNAREVNKLLFEKGYITGRPGDWVATEKGKRYCEEVVETNGYGGCAARGWSYLLWDDEIANLIGNPKKRLSELNDINKKLGLSTYQSWDDYFKHRW